MYLVLEGVSFYHIPFTRSYSCFGCFNVEPKAAELFCVGQVSLVAKNTSSSLWGEKH